MIMQGKYREEKKVARSKIREYFHSLLEIHSDMMSYEEIDAMMEENTVIRGSNMWILMLAILIASIGLNVNSTAVIIGAMLISPLMSGILTMGYSLAIRELSMLKKALGRYATQVAISLITSTLYFLISPLSTPTSEMIARTAPTIWDVLIAFFGGIAGIIGNTRKKKGNVVPGVAIATALMPPLCTAGYGLATMQAQFFFGAFYLFIINTLFIALSAALITKILGVPYHQNLDTKKQKKINHIVAAITIITVIPSIFIGSLTVYNTYLEHNIDNYLENEFVFTDTQLVRSNVDKNSKTITVSLVGTPISNDAIALLENELDKYNLGEYSLRVTQNSILAISDEEEADKITIAVQENTISELQELVNTQQEKLNELENTISARIDFDATAQKAESIFTDLHNCCCGVISDGNDEYIILLATTDRTLTEKEIETIENWLKAESSHTKAKLYIEKAAH
ncbi:MAG: DUF389 domain-containing protein [Lachnospiraceae bacterium]